MPLSAKRNRRPSFAIASDKRMIEGFAYNLRLSIWEFIMEKRIIGFIIALSSLTYGVWLLAPFADITLRQPRWIWAWLMIMSGAILLYAELRHSHVTERRALAFSTFLWVGVCVAIFLINWRSLAFIQSLWWSMLCAYTYLRVAVNG